MQKVGVVSLTESKDHPRRERKEKERKGKGKDKTKFEPRQDEDK